MGVTLAAVADHRNLLALDQVEIGVPIIIHAHGMSFTGVSLRLRMGADGAPTAGPVAAF
jgi:hypothetical protein